MKNQSKTIDRAALAKGIKIACGIVSLAYFALLIAGKWIFKENNAFYLGINIFLGSGGEPDKWLRSLSYVIFLLSLSYVIRLILKQFSRLLDKGKAFVDLICSFIKYIAVIALIFAVLSVWGVNTDSFLRN